MAPPKKASSEPNYFPKCLKILLQAVLAFHANTMAALGAKKIVAHNE